MFAWGMAVTSIADGALSGACCSARAPSSRRALEGARTGPTGPACMQETILVLLIDGSYGLHPIPMSGTHMTSTDASCNT